MKKKIAIILVTIILLTICLVLCSCEDDRMPIENIPQQNGTNSAFVLVSRDKIDETRTLFVVYHNKTKVMYLITTYKGGYGAGVSITVMLDENGKPLLYEGETK